jgi:hypothetical protein
MKGQGVLEMLLMLVVVMGIWMGVTKILANRGTFAAIFGTPWVRLKNTVEYGIPSDKNNLMNQHPAHGDRHSTRTVRQ